MMMGGVLRSITDDSLIDRSLRWVVRWWRRSGRGRDDGMMYSTIGIQEYTLISVLLLPPIPAANLIPMALVSTPTSPAHAHPGGGGGKHPASVGGRLNKQHVCNP